MNFRAASIDIPVGIIERRRGFRVFTLCLAVALLGAGDLYNTITHTNSVGFIEANPVAQHMVYAQSHLGLILFKFGTIGIATGLLLRTRHHLSSELGGWAILVAMVALTIQWQMYNHEVVQLMAEVRQHELPEVLNAARSG